MMHVQCPFPTLIIINPEKQVKVLPDQIDSAWAEYSDYIKDNDHNRDSAKCMHEHHDFLLLSLQECKDTVEELTKERSEMTAEVKKLLDAVSKKKKHLAKFRTDRRSEKESLYCKIDMILGEYDILRAEYHGGDLTGGHVKILMKKASQIMEQIAAVGMPSCRRYTKWSRKKKTSSDPRSWLG